MATFFAECYLPEIENFAANPLQNKDFEENFIIYLPLDRWIINFKHCVNDIQTNMQT